MCRVGRVGFRFAGHHEGADAVAASGYNDPAANSKLYESLGSTFYNNKQYAEAATAFQKAAAADAKNWHAAALAGESLFAAGQKEQAITAFQHAVQASVAAGAKPDESVLKRAVSIAYQAQSPDLHCLVHLHRRAMGLEQSRSLRWLLR